MIFPVQKLPVNNTSYNYSKFINNLVCSCHYVVAILRPAFTYIHIRTFKKSVFYLLTITYLCDKYSCTNFISLLEWISYTT